MAHGLVDGVPTRSFGHQGVVGERYDGVLIAPNWVLTASHVARSGVVFHAGVGEAPIDAAYLAPGAKFPDHDIALLHLASPLSAASMPRLNAKLLSGGDAAEFGTVTLVAADNGEEKRFVRSRLARTFDTYQGPNGVLHTTWWIAVDAPGDVPLVQGGDSGSVLYAGSVDDSDGLILGIASAQCKAPYAPYSCYVQPAAYREWIDATMAASGQSAVWDVPSESRAWWLWPLGGGGAVAAAGLAAVVVHRLRRHRD
ncbi:MAG: trypsin-like serine protease [Burkholderiales bacterium]|nr:trypsin-like serine protease [Burkholderiales bacterium]